MKPAKKQQISLMTSSALRLKKVLSGQPKASAVRYIDPVKFKSMQYALVCVYGIGFSSKLGNKLLEHNSKLANQK
jgi:hypothetical protein